MISKNTLNFAHLLLLVLFTAILLDPLVNAQSKTFEVSNKIKSAKAIVGTDKKFEVNVAFNPVDYDPVKYRSFDLNVGGCKLSVKARKNSDGSTVGFEFNNGKDLPKSIDNPKSFKIIGQELIFANSIDNDKGTVKCNQKINFVTEGDQSTIELSLTGDDIPDGLVLSSDNLTYNDESAETKAKANVWLFVGIGVGIFVAFLLIVASIFVVICIKRWKQKIVGKKSKEQVKTAISAEISTAKEVSKEQTSSVKDNKPAKSAPRNEKQNVEKDQKLGAQEEQLIEVPENYPYPKYFIRTGPVLTKEQIAKREHYRKLYYESLKNNPGTLARANEENGVDIEVLALRASQEENAFIKAMEEKDAANERAKAQEQKFN